MSRTKHSSPDKDAAALLLPDLDDGPVVDNDDGSGSVSAQDSSESVALNNDNEESSEDYAAEQLMRRLVETATDAGGERSIPINKRFRFGKSISRGIKHLYRNVRPKRFRFGKSIKYGNYHYF